MEDLGRGLGFNTLSQRIKMWGLATFTNSTLRTKVPPDLSMSAFRKPLQDEA